MVEFYVAVQGGTPPQNADPSALGGLPTAAFRYCEPVRTASKFGWYIFLPRELGIIWDQDNIYWSLDEFETRHLLTDAIQYPNFSQEFNSVAPGFAKDFSPPFLTRTNDDDMVQIWTGLFARTEPGTGLWVRGPVNMAHQMSFHVLEGVIETDWWFGPLFANIRITRRDTPVFFRQTKPFLQVLPFQKETAKTAAKNGPVVHHGLEALTETEWAGYQRAVVDRMRPETPPGDYAVKARKAALV